MIDSLYEFSDAQTLAGSAHSSTDVADLTGGTQGKDAFGNSINIPLGAKKMFFNVRVTTATGGGACAISLYTHTGTTVKSGTEVASVIIPSGAAIGDCFSIGIEPSSAAWLRYVGAVLDARSNGCTGNVDVWLGVEPVTQNKLPR